MKNAIENSFICAKMAQRKMLTVSIFGDQNKQKCSRKQIYERLLTALSIYKNILESQKKRLHKQLSTELLIMQQLNVRISDIS